MNTVPRIRADRPVQGAAMKMLRLAGGLLLGVWIGPAPAAEPVDRNEVGSLAYQGERVRLYAVAAPRAEQSCQEWRGGQPVSYACGQHAKAFLQSLVAGRDPFCVDRKSVV